MPRSVDRILTTHTGSLPRPPDLIELLYQREAGQAVDETSFTQRVREAVDEVVATQLQRGLDVINDGEMGKVGYSTYVTERLTGFEGPAQPRPDGVDQRLVPGLPARVGRSATTIRTPSCNGPVTWRGDEQVQRDILNLQRAVDAAGKDPSEVFMTAASPGVVWYFLPNTYYPSPQTYLDAIAEAMHHEYRAIADAGFLLQLDCPDLAGGWNRPDFADLTFADFRKLAQLHVDVLNAAVADIPAEHLRMHVCWGNYPGPHLRDIPLREILDVLLSARPAALSFEGANPRHEHEWAVFQERRLPEGKTIMPGVLDSMTNYVEHPELVAQRIVRYAEVVGRENVLAGSDCGFSTFAGSADVHPQVAWLKLQSLAEGARLASELLWG